METWPTSGTMQNGQVFELQMPERHISVSESLLLRSPTASQAEGGALGEAVARERGNTVGIRDQAMDIARAQGLKVTREVENLLITPMVDDSKNTGHNNTRLNSLAKQTYKMTEFEKENINWGKFEPAIRRWEKILGVNSPAPTKADGRQGNHRLSSEFTEWLMGLDKGWVTGAGLRRSEEIKACGNGVVPQQAEMALRILLQK